MIWAVQQGDWRGVQTNTLADVGSVDVERETAFKVERSGGSASPRPDDSEQCSHAACGSQPLDLHSYVENAATQNQQRPPRYACWGLTMKQGRAGYRY